MFHLMILYHIIRLGKSMKMQIINDCPKLKKSSFITLPTMIYSTNGNNLDPVIVLGLFFRLGINI